MTPALVGLSHRTAPVEVRERLAFPGDEAAHALSGLHDAGVAQVVLLATCNRTELYFESGEEETFARAVDFLERAAGALPEPLPNYLYRHSGDSVALHLFRVVSGLDSMVPGEAEVQGQVREAYQRAAGSDPAMTGAVLNRLFQTALSVGGRVRSETAIGEGSASVASVAVELARKIFGDLRDRRVLVLGAGETAERMVASLGREGVQGVMVANRTYDRAVDLAERLHGRAVRMEEITRALADADIVLTSTSAPHFLVTASNLTAAYPAGVTSPLLMVDIAIPRDIDPELGGVADVFLYNVDDLQRILDESLDRRRVAAVDAESLIAREVEGFALWHRSLAVVPAIRALREHGERVRASEVARLIERMPHLSGADRDAVEAFSRRLLNQLLHEPTARLREAAEEGRGEEALAAVRHWGEGHDLA